jgi:4-carboxymuconolactone decarboxylase
MRCRETLHGKRSQREHCQEGDTLDEAQRDASYEIGMRVRREVLGDAHVDQALERATDFDADFQRFITETAWGSVWSRPDLDRRTRSLITIAVLAALGRNEELALHLRATRNTSATPHDIAKTLLHVAAYAGIPAANAAVAIARSELIEPRPSEPAPG